MSPVRGADPEDPGEYRALNILWVPKEARWSQLRNNAPQPTIGRLVDDAMGAVERDNPSLKGVPPKDYARQGLDRQRLGQLINMVSNIGLGDCDSRSRDVLGRVYEYDGEPFEEAMGRLVAQRRDQQAEVTKLEAAIAANLKELGYGG